MQLFAKILNCSQM